MNKLLLGVFLSWLGLAGAAICASAADSSALRIEKTGSIYTEGVPTQIEKDRALAAALRGVVLVLLEQSSLSPAKLRLCKMNLDQGDLAALKKLDLVGEPQIISERSRSGYYEIKIIASPKQSQIIAWSDQFKGDPPIKKLRMMVVIPEHHLQNPIPDPAGETEMIRLMVQEGFRVVDQAQVKTIRDKDLVKRAIKGDQKELLAIAQSFGAELLLVGEAFSQDVRSVAGRLPACRARIEARIVQCDTADILSAGDAEDGAEDLSPAVAAKAALRKASARLYEKLASDILTRPAPVSSRIRVILAGCSFEDKLVFKRLLQSLKELINEVQELSFQDSRAEFDIITSAASSTIAEEIFIGAKKEKINLKVAEQSNRRCVFDINPKDPSATGK